ncbi:ABC transporter substrate-binding protein [Candidatus Dependentiae bacterium]|nr:ABC transporter substrate-binding protein [Candidatus Dependentiae bacterium]
MKFKKLLILSWLIGYFTNAHAFNNLDQVQQMISQYDEYPDIDNNNYLKPNYSSFYQKNVPSFLNRQIIKVLDFIGIRKEFWNVEDFQEILKKVTNERAKKHTGNFIVKITPTSKTDFIIFGDLHGAFHSLVHDLDKLKQLKIINTDLKIIKPNNFIIFNGNVISRSPYILETLTLILQLMDKNPDKVFYLIGQNEINENWTNWGLKKELRYKTKHLSDEKIPLNDEINQFISTLPLAIYIDFGSKENVNLIRISNFDRTYKELDESYFYDFLKQQSSQKITFFNLDEKKYTDKTIDIRVIIKSLERKFKYQPTDGLENLYPDKGSTAWSVFSSPTLANQKLYNFTNDAFALLSVEPNQDPTITLYKQDAKKRNGYSIKEYNLLTEEIIKEETTTPIEQKEQILIGTLLPLHGTYEDLGKPIFKGINNRIKEENSKNGINGQKIKLIALDSKYDIYTYKQKLKELLQTYNIDITLCNAGTATLQESLAYIQENNIGIFFPYTGADIFRNSNLSNLINIKTSYSKEAQTLINYLINNIQYGKIAIIYQNDLYGKNFKEATTQVLEANNISSYIQIPYEKNLSDIDEKVKKIEREIPKTIIFFSTTPATTKFLEKIDPKFLLNKNLVGNSILLENKFLNFIKDKGLKFIFSQTAPDIKTSNLEIVQEYKKIMQKNNNSLDQMSLESYIATDIFIDLLHKINGEITNKNIMNQAEKIKNYQHKGLVFNFDPQTRQILNDVWIRTETGKIISYKPQIKEIKKTKPEIKKETKKIKQLDKTKKIEVGTTMDLSAELADLGRNVLNGMRLCISNVNKTTNLKILLNAMDDKYIPSLALENIETLLKRGIDILLTPVGSHQLKRYLPLIKDEKILVLFPEATSSEFRQPDLKYLIHYFATSQQEAKAAINYLLKNEINIKKLVLFYQTEPFSLSALQGAKSILEKNNLKEGENWIAVSHPPNTINIEDAANKTINFDPQAIVLLSVPTPSKAYIEKLGANFIINKTIFGISTCSGPEFTKFAKLRNIKYLYSQLTPSPKQKDLEIINEFIKLSEQKGIKSNNIFALEGFITTSIFAYILSKINGEITKEKIINTIESIKNYNFKGLRLNFNPKTREISSNNLWISLPDGKTILAEKEEDYEAQEEPTKFEVQYVKEDEDNEIRIGTTLDVSSKSSEIGRGILDGLYLKIRQQNQIGGINGKNIKFNYKNDKYQPDLAKQNIQELIAENTNILISPTGSYSFKSAIPFIQEGKISVFFPSANAPIFYDSNLKNIINFGPSSFYEGQVLANFALNKYKPEKVLIFYQSDLYCNGAKKGINSVLTDSNQILEISHASKEYITKKDIKKIEQFKPQVIFILSYPNPARDFLEKLGPNFLIDKKIYGIDSLAGYEFQKFIKSNNLNYTVVETLHDLNSNLEIVKEYKKIVQQSNKELNTFTLKGYIAASVFIDIILKNIKGKITREKLIQQAESLNNINYKGLQLNFNPEQRNIYQTLWIHTNKGKVLQKNITPIKKESTKKITKPKIKFDQNKINIATTMDLSAELSDLGKPLLEGIYLRFNEINKKGGINGHRINLIPYDDNYNPKKTIQYFKKLIEQGNNIILSPSGSYQLGACLPLIKTKDIGIFFPDASAPIFHQRNLKNIINLVPSSFQDAQVLTEFLINDLNIKKIALFHQNEPFSEGALAGAKYVLKKYGFKKNKDWIVTSHLTNTLKIDDAATKIKNFKPEAILFLSLALPGKVLIEKLGANFLFNKKLLGVVSYATKSFLDFIKSQNLKFIHTQNFPDPKKSSIKIVQEYRKAAENKKYEPNIFQLQGYVLADLFAELLKKTNGLPDKDKLIEYAEQIKNLDHKGLFWNFNPQTRGIATTVWINLGNGKIISKKLYSNP